MKSVSHQMVTQFLKKLYSFSAAPMKLGAILFAFATPAKAVLVTVGSITYDLQVQTSGQDYFDQQAAIEASPWWTSNGSSALTALQFADAYLAAVGPSANALFFAFSAPAQAVRSFGETGGARGCQCIYFNEDAYFTAIALGNQTGFPALGNNIIPARASANDTAPFPNFSFVTGTEVPEINGPVLAQLALVLGVFYLGLSNLRRRRQNTLPT